MRNLSIIFAMLFFGITLSAQEETVSYIMNDGSVKTYNLSDIEEICMQEIYDDYTMSIYCKGAAPVSYTSNQFDSVKYSRDYNNNYIYLVYRGAERDSYLLADIDSIRYGNYTIAENPVQKQMMQMADVLGLEIKTKSSMDRMADKIDQLQSATNSIIKTGDIVEFGYHDEGDRATYKFKINEAESNKDNLVYYGDRVNDPFNKSSNNDEGTGPRYRKTISTTENGIMVKTELKRGDGYVPRETREYVANGNTIEEYVCWDDGTKGMNYIYKPNTKNTLTKEDAMAGTKYNVDNISIFQK